jgi:hypothetical protein
LADLLLADEPLPARLSSARPVEDAVLCEELHDRPEIMRIEAVEEALGSIACDLAPVCYLAPIWMDRPISGVAVM